MDDRVEEQAIKVELEFYVLTTLRYLCAIGLPYYCKTRRTVHENCQSIHSENLQKPSLLISHLFRQFLHHLRSHNKEAVMDLILEH